MFIQIDCMQKKTSTYEFIFKNKYTSTYMYVYKYMYINAFADMIHFMCAKAVLGLNVGTSRCINNIATPKAGTCN